jgi:ribosome-associated protein
MTTLSIHGDQITLAQAIKAAGLVGSGGQAKQIVRAGQVNVNGTVETHPGRKLAVGDRVTVAGETEFTIGR